MLRRLAKRRRRAVGFIFFILILFPVLIVALGLSADFGRLIVGHRQAADTADSVALAAAHAFNANSDGSNADASLNSALSLQYAQETFYQALGPVPGQGSMLGAVESPNLSSVRVTNGNTRVEVKITYKMTGFVALDYLMGKRNNLSFTVTRTAEVCSNATVQYCAYPVR